MSASPAIFLNYALQDRAKVEDVYDSLCAEGCHPWMDIRDILPGENRPDRIDDAVNNADVMLIFISQNSVDKHGKVLPPIAKILSVFLKRIDQRSFLVPIRLDTSALPASLKAIQYVDLFDKEGWTTLLQALKRHMEDEKPPLGRIRDSTNAALDEDQADERQGLPYVFVAMPFNPPLVDDVFFSGIAPAARDAGFACERVDQTAFLGCILDQIKNRITNASAVIVDLTGANPNVYLELGFAWGMGIPTVLLLREGNQLCFDVRGQRCLVYRNLKELRVVLAEELARLKAAGDIR